MKNSKLTLIGLVDALGVAVYIIIVALIMQNGDKIFGQIRGIFGPVTFLLLFVLSAAITGGLTLGRPIVLYLEGQKSEAVKLFFYTLSWLIIFTLTAFFVLIIR